MASTDILPLTAGTYSENWTNTGSFPNNVRTDDGNSTRRNIAGGNAGRDTHNYDSLPTAAVAINEVIVRAKINRQSAGSGNWRLYQRYSGTDENGSSDFTVTTSYVEYSRTLASAADASAWTPAIVDASEFGYQRRTSGAADCRCTYSRVSVDYVEGGEHLITFLHSFLPPLVGAALTAGLLARALTLVDPRVRRTDEEVRECLRIFREWKQPAFVFLGAPA